MLDVRKKKRLSVHWIRSSSREWLFVLSATLHHHHHYSKTSIKRNAFIHSFIPEVVMHLVVKLEDGGIERGEEDQIEWIAAIIQLKRNDAIGVLGSTSPG